MIRSEERAGRLAVFDVCGTLVRDNTTIGFLRHHFRGNKRFQHLDWALTSRLSPFFYVTAATARFLGWDVARILLIRSLTGENRQRLERSADIYAEDVLVNRANNEVMRRLQEHLLAGDHVILVSASLDIVIAALARHLAVDYHASKVAFRQDKCLGRLECDVMHIKHELVGAVLKESKASALSVYTDNSSDLRLLALADQAVVIATKDRRMTWLGDIEHERIDG